MTIIQLLLLATALLILTNSLIGNVKHLLDLAEYPILPIQSFDFAEKDAVSYAHSQRSINVSSFTFFSDNGKKIGQINNILVREQDEMYEQWHWFANTVGPIKISIFQNSFQVLKFKGLTSVQDKYSFKISTKSYDTFYSRQDGLFILIGEKQASINNQTVILEYNQNELISFHQIKDNSNFEQVVYALNRTHICYTIKWDDISLWTVQCLKTEDQSIVASFNFSEEILIEASQKRFIINIIPKYPNNYIYALYLRPVALKLLPYQQFKQNQQIIQVKSCYAQQQQMDYMLVLSKIQDDQNYYLVSLLSSKQNSVELLDQQYFYQKSVSESFQCINSNIAGTGINYAVTAIIAPQNQWLVIVPIASTLVLFLLSVLIISRIKFTFIKNMKTYLRTFKFIYYLIALLISLLNLKIMFLLVQDEPHSILIKQIPLFYFMQYFLLIQIITLYQCYQDNKQQNFYLKLHMVQGLSIFTYYYTKLYYIVLMIVILAVVNTFCISFFNKVVIQDLEDYLVVIAAFISCTLSNIILCLFITIFFKRYLFMVSILVIHHIISAVSLQTTRMQNYQKHPLSYIYRAYNGIYCYYDIIYSQLSPFVSAQKQHYYNNIFYTFLFSVGQTVIYTIIYLFALYLKNRKTIHKQIIYRTDSSIHTNITKQKLLSDEPTSLANQHTILQISNASKTINKKQIFNQVNLSVLKGQILVILGANQTGKTTLLNTMLCLQTLSIGTVIMEKDVNIGCCLQAYICYDQLTFIENIQYLAQIKNIKQKEINQVVEDMVDTFYFEDQKNKKASELSGGNLKKLCLACAFVGEPKMLIFDEPSLGLDVNFKKLFWQLLKQKKNKGVGVIVATSDLEQAQVLADRIFMIEQNKIYSNLNEIRKYEIGLTFGSRNQKNSVQDTIKRNKLIQIIPVLNSAQIKCRLSKNNQLQSQAVTNIINNHMNSFEYIRFSINHKSYIDPKLQRLCQKCHTNHTRINIILLQAKGVMLKRLKILKYNKGLTVFIILAMTVINIISKILGQSDVVIKSLTICLNIFIYFESSIIRHDELVSKRIKNAIIFGMNEFVYWFTFFLVDIFILLLLYSISLLLNMLFFQIGCLAGITSSCDFDDFNNFHIVFVYLTLLTIINYFFSNLLKNHLLFIFVVFFINGFSYFLLQNQAFSLVKGLQFAQYYYFPQMFYLITFKNDKSALSYLILQLFIWTLFFAIYLFIKQRMSVRQTKIDAKHVNIENGRVMLQEHQRIEDVQDITNIPIIVQDIFKFYNKTKADINGVVMMIEKGQVYGLLGANGSGKTTIFNIVTGLMTANAGMIKYFGVKLNSMSFLQHRKVGYCPQFDYLDQMLTIGQNIEYYGAIKGMSKSELNKFIQLYLPFFKMNRQINDRVQNISVGDRRKLCSILTFIGNPKILFFDEPSAGMDTECRQKLWQLIHMYCLQNQAAVLLTTHNIHEAESYCNKIGVLKRGRLIAIDSPQKLIEKHSNKFRLILKYKMPENIEAIKQKIHNSHPLYDITHNQQSKKLIYDFPINKTKPDHILTLTIKMVNQNKLLDYFQFFQHNLQNVIAQLSTSAKYQSAIMVE